MKRTTSSPTGGIASGETTTPGYERSSRSTTRRTSFAYIMGWAAGAQSVGPGQVAADETGRDVTSRRSCPTRQHEVMPSFVSRGQCRRLSIGSGIELLVPAATRSQRIPPVPAITARGTGLRETRSRGSRRRLLARRSSSGRSPPPPALLQRRSSPPCREGYRPRRRPGRA